MLPMGISDDANLQGGLRKIHYVHEGSQWSEIFHTSSLNLPLRISLLKPSVCGKFI